MLTPQSLDIQPKFDISALPTGLLIDGQWRTATGGGRIAALNPATGKVLAEVEAAGAADVDAAVQAARRALDGAWKQVTAMQRSKMLWKLADLIEAHADELAELETLNNGMPLSTARSGFIPAAIDTFRYMSGWATKIHGRTFDMSVAYMPGARFNTVTRKCPVGVVGTIIPWNAPILMFAWKLAPALAAGCTVVLKPAEQTPLTALRLGQLVLEAGFPPGVVNILNGLGETVGAALATHPGVDKIAFTGSTEVGKLIVKNASMDLKRVSLELGGKSPNIIFDDADVDAAVAGAGMGIFFNSGQNCAAGSRLYVQERVYDRVVADVAKAASQMKVGNGLAADTQIGPLVSKEQLDRVMGFIERGRKGGAAVLVGGEQLGTSGYFAAPTVIAPAVADAEVMTKEIFGPVLSILKFKDEDDVVRLANDTRYGLASGVWTRDLARANRMADRLESGVVWVNTYNAIGASMPFGGFKESGWGKELGEEVLESYLDTKAIVMAA